MRCIKIFVILFLVVLYLPSAHARTVIVVRDQSSFDGLQGLLEKTLSTSEKDIYVCFQKGKYIAKEKHISISGIRKPNTRLYFIGNNSIIIPDGREYVDEDVFKGPFDPGNSWILDEEIMDFWSEVKYAETQVEVIDQKSFLCRLKSEERIADNPNPEHSYILIPHWYRSSTYKITKIKDQYIYFTAADLEISYNRGYNVNDDYNIWKKKVRYKLCNVEDVNEGLSINDGRIRLSSISATIREAQMNCFMVIENSSLSSIAITGFNYNGNSNYGLSSLLYLSNVYANDIAINDCCFHGLRSKAISVLSSNNVRIEDNAFYDCYLGGILSDNGSMSTKVINNTFIRMGKGLKNTFCVICRGCDYYVSGNKMIDFGYGGIGVGVWYKSPMNIPCRGVSENNDLSYTKEYLSNIDNNCIMDGGAIYIWTKNERAIIRNNHIHGFSGMAGNRGIFCDDGAFNVQIIGNVITGIENSYCIESRRVSSVECTQTPESGIMKSNINVVIKDNILDGPILFEGNEIPDNGCIKKSNYILYSGKGDLPKNSITNIQTPSEDIVLDYYGETNGKECITTRSSRALKKAKIWRNVRQYFVKVRN